MAAWPSSARPTAFRSSCCRRARRLPRPNPGRRCPTAANGELVPGLLLNIDVPDVAAAEAFYTRAFGLKVGRRFDADWVELIGLEAPLHLLGKKAGSASTPATEEPRRYDRHWS